MRQAPGRVFPRAVRFIAFSLFTLALFTTTPLPAQAPPVIVGAERLEQYIPLLDGKQVAVVVNNSSRAHNEHLLDLLLRHGICVTRIFAPEHGFRSDTPDGEEVRNDIDVRTGVPVVSLYGKKRKPLPADLLGVDVVVFDIQDVGTRFFTFISTLFLIEEACAENGKALIVLDRPNPNGHYIDGPLLEPDQKSFVGIAPIPIVHGCTVGELALLFAGEGFIKNAWQLDLSVIACENYTHRTRYRLPIRPSPNLPNQRAILLYPSLCFFEGTCISIGRGTDYPFQIYGHPDYAWGDYVFTPCPNEGSKSPPHESKICQGFDLSDLGSDSLYALGRIDLHYLLDLYCEFPFKSSFFLPNKYFDLLAGTPYLRELIELGTSEEDIRESWADGLAFFRLVRKDYLIYPE